MATEADIPAPICETRREQGESILDPATSISINKIPQEEKAQGDTPNEPPTVERENFLTTPSIGKVQCEINDISPDANQVTEKPDQTVKDDAEILLPKNIKSDDQPLEIDASDETSSKRSQESSTSTETIVNATSNSDELQSKNEISSSLCEEDSISIQRGDRAVIEPEDSGILLENNVNENKGDVANQSKTLEDIASNPTVTGKTEASSLIQVDGSQMERVEQLEKESEKLQLIEEDSISIQRGDRAAIEPEDSGILLENNVNENKGDVANQSKTLEDIASNPTVTGKTEASSLIQVDGSQMERVEQLEKESEKLRLIEVSTVASNDNEPAGIDNVKYEDEDIRKAELFKNEKSASTLPDEEERAEKPVESLHIAPENIEAANLGQDNKTSSIEEQSTDANLQGITSDVTGKEIIDAVDTQKEVLESFSAREGSITANLQEITSESTDEKTIDEIDTPKEVHESFSTIVSNKEIEEKLMISEIKNTEHLGEESERTNSPLPVAKEASDLEPVVMHDTRIEEEELRKAELCENEKSTDSMLLKIESELEKPKDSLDVASEDAKASDLGQETDTSSFKEQSLTDDTTVDAAETKEETLEAQNVATIVLNEATNESSSIQVDGLQMKDVEHLEKEREKLSVTKDLTWNTNDDELTAIDEVKTEGENPRREELFEKEKDTENALLKEEVQTEKPVESFHAALEDIKAEEKTVDAVDTKEETHEAQDVATIVSNEKASESSLIQVDGLQMKDEEHLEKESEKPSLVKDSGNANDNELTAMDQVKIDGEIPRKEELFEKEKNIQNALLKEELQMEKHLEPYQAAFEDIKAEDRTVEAAETKEQTLEDVATIVSNEKAEESSLNQVAGLQMKDEEHLEKESEKPSPAKDLTGNANDNELTAMEQVKIEGEIPRTDEVFEKEKNIEGALLKEELQMEKPVEPFHAAFEDIKAEDRTVEAAETKEETLENVATIVSNEKAEESSLIQVTGSQMEDEVHLENESEKPYLTTDLTGNANDNGLTIMGEVKLKDENPRSAELFEKEKNIESPLLKEQLQIEKPVESFHAALEDNKVDAKTVDAAETEETLENVAIIVSNEKAEESSLIQVDGSQMKDEEHLEKESEKPSSTKDLTGNANDNELRIMGEVKFEDENPRSAKLFEKEKNIESPLLKEEMQIEKPVESFHAALEDNKVDEKTVDAAETKEETLEQNVAINATDMEVTVEVQNVATTIPHEDTKANSVIQVDCSQMEHEDHLEKDNENRSLTEAPTEETYDESKNMHELINRDEDLIKAEFLENEKYVASTPVKGEAGMEKPIDSLHVAAEDIKASDLSQDTKTSSIEEDIPTAEQEEISGDKIEENTINAADTKEETLEDIGANVPDGDNADNSPTEDGSQKPCLKEASTGNTSYDESTITHEATLLDESSTKADLSENKKNIDVLIKEEVSTESLQVAAEYIKTFTSAQDREASSLEENPIANQGIIVDYTEDKINEAANMKEENLEDKSVATNIPCEDTEENSPIHVDGSQMEQNEQHLEKESENLSWSEAPTGESTSVINKKEEVKHIDSLQLATDDIKVSASDQHTETGSIKEQNLITEPQEIAGDNSEEKTIAAAYTNKETLEIQNAATTIPHEDTEVKSVIQVDCSQMEHKELEKESGDPSLIQVPTEETRDESKDVHESKDKDEDLVKAELLENEKDISVKEEACAENPVDSLQVATEDIKASDPIEDTKICSTEEQILNANQQEIPGDKIEEKTIDAADTKEEILEDIATNVPIGNNEGDPPTEEDGSQDSSFKEFSTGNANDDESTIKHEAKIVDQSSIKVYLPKNDKNTEDTLVKDEVSTESLQVAAEDIKTFASVQERETSSLEEQGLIADHQGIIVGRKEDNINEEASLKEENLEDKSVVTTIPCEDTEENSRIHVDGSQMEQNEQHLEKESENPSLSEVPTGDTTESTLVINKTEVEKPINSPQVAIEGIIVSASDQHTETSSIEEKILIMELQEISGDNSEEKTIAAAYTNKETLEIRTVATTIPHEDTEVKSVIQVDSSQMEHEQHLEKESENPSLIEVPTEETKDEAKDEHESRDEDEDKVKAALLENEKDILVKEEACVEKSIDSLQVAIEDTKASDSSEETKIHSIEEEIPGDKIEEKNIDAADTKEEVLEDIATNIPNGDSEGESPIKEDGSQYPSLKEASTRKANDDESTIMHEDKFLDESSIKADLSENDKNREDTLLKEEVSMESLQVAFEDTKAFASVQDRETSSAVEQSQTADHQGIISDHKEDKKNDSANVKEETPEDKNIATTIPCEDTEENSLIHVDCSQMEHSEHLEKESENPSSEEAPAGDSRECTLVIKEAHGEKPIGSLEAASEDIKAYTSGQDTETSSIEKQIRITDPKEIAGDNTEEKTIDAVSTNEETLVVQQNVAPTIPHEHTEENSVTQVEQLENESENLSLTEAPTEETKDDKSRHMHEPENRDEDLTKVELLERENYVVTTSVKEEAPVEMHIDSLQVAAEDKIFDLSQDTKINSTEEQIITADPQEISCDKIKEKAIDVVDMKEETVEDIATNVSTGDNEDKTPIKEAGLENPPWKEFSTGNTNDDESMIMDDAKFVEESSIKTDFFENEKRMEDTFVKEEVSTESLGVTAEDIKAFASVQSRETSSLEEQSLTANHQGIIGDSKEDKTNDATGVNEETPEDKNVETTYKEIEDNPQIDVDCSHMEQNKQLEKEDESLSSAEAPAGDTKESTLVINEAQEKKLIDSFQVAPEDINAFTSGQERETGSTEEQLLSTDQEISGDNKEEKTIDAAYMNEETLGVQENVATTIPREDTAENSVIQVDCSQMEHLEKESEQPSSEKVPLGETKGTTLVKEEAQVEKLIDSFQVAGEDTKSSALGKDLETKPTEEQMQTAAPQEIAGDKTEEETIDKAYKEEALETQQNVATTIPPEDTEVSSVIQEDCSQKEHEGHLQKESEILPLTEVPTKETNDESRNMDEPKNGDEYLIKAELLENEKYQGSTSEKEEACVEKPTDSLQVTTEDIKASDSSEDTKISSIKEETIPADPQEISEHKIEGKTIDAGPKKEETLEDISTNVPSGDSEDNSLIEEADEDESTTTREVKFVDEISTKANLFENDKNTEDTLVKEEVSIESLQAATEDVKVIASVQNTETSSLEEQSLTSNCQGIMGDHKEDKTNDAADVSEETPEDKVSKQIENIDIGARTKELNEEEGYLKDLQMETAVGITAPEEKSPDSIFINIPHTKGLDVNKDMAVDIAEDPNCKQEESSSIMKVLEEQMIISKENAANVTSLASEASESNSDHKVVGEANSCDDRTDTENLVETDPKEGTEAEAQVLDEEKEEELMQEDPKAGTDQKDIEEELHTTSLQTSSKSNGVNGEEEKKNPDNCKEISVSSKTVALEEVSSSNVESEEVSTPNPFQESSRKTWQEAENEEAQKQGEDLHVLALVKDSLMEEKETDVQLHLAGAHDFDITQEMQKLEEASLPSADEKIIENITETTNCKESEVLEDATKDQYIEHLKEDDTTKSFLDDQKPTEREHKETEDGQEEVTLDETEKGIKESTSILGANDFLPQSSKETSEVRYFTTERELKIDATECTVLNNNTGLEDSLVNSRFIGDRKTKIDDEAPEIIETIPTPTEGQEIKSISVGETSSLTSQSERDEYEHASIGSTIKEKSNSNEVEFAHGENRSGYEFKNQVPESIAQDQSSDIISKAEETKTDEENLETAAQVKSEAEDRFEPKETMKVDILSQKIKGEDEHVENYHPDSFKEEVIRESRLEDELKQGEEIKTEEIFEVIKNANETEKVPEVFEEADNKAVAGADQNLRANESTERSFHQTEEGKSVEEFTTIVDTEEAHELDPAHNKTGTEDSREEDNSSGTAFLEDGDNRKGADSIDDEIEKDEGLVNQSSNTSLLDAAAEVMPKRLHEKIIGDAAPAKPVHETIEDSEGKKEIANTIMIQWQEEDKISKNESLLLPEYTQGQESERPNQNDEICSSEEVQAKVEENLMLSAAKSKDEAHKAESLLLPEFTKGKESEKQDQKDEICSSEDAQAKVEENLMLSAAESKDEAHKAENILLSEFTQGKESEKQDQKDEICSSEEVQVKDEENLMLSAAKSKNEAHKAEGLLLPEFTQGKESEKQDQKQETEEQPGRTSEAVSKAKEVNCDEKEAIVDQCNEMIENSSSAATEMVSESNIHQRHMEETAQNDKNKESQGQIGPVPILPHIKCSDMEPAEKNLPMHSAGLDGSNATELEVTSLPAKDKHVFLEADRTKNVNPENSIGNKTISVIQHGGSAECSQDEGDMLKPSKLNQEEAKCGHEEKTSHETTKSREKYELKEIGQPSLSDLLQASMKETLQMADQSAIRKEPTTHGEDLQAKRTNEGEHEDSKIDEEKEDEEELSEERRSNLGSEALVMVNVGDADVKIAHKKSHNILSGVGSKVKHSIAKVKKAITCTSSHPKPPSPPKQGDKF